VAHRGRTALGCSCMFPSNARGTGPVKILHLRSGIHPSVLRPPEVACGKPPTNTLGDRRLSASGPSPIFFFPSLPRLLHSDDGFAPTSLGHRGCVPGDRHPWRRRRRQPFVFHDQGLDHGWKVTHIPLEARAIFRTRPDTLICCFLFLR